ncbi:MAG: monovalent cation/H(+) antiporter subunit G [bacterium]|nr:monovalent cation/H(+) antiporter subunit G [bacterium]
MADLLVIALTLGGLFFLTTGTLGLIRLPDIFTRMHATAKCDTMGAGLLLGALAVRCGAPLTAIKLVLVAGGLWVVGPTTAHIIANVAYRRELERCPGTTTRDLYEGRGSGCPKP